jgi:ubiquinone/menaquinone biosynthesis C-methylase UbiE
MNLHHRMIRKLRSWMNRDIYRKAYQEHSALNPGDDAIGDGDFDIIGQIELSLLKLEGLQPTHTLLDLGCGTGRLAIHAVPYLAHGHYIGVDIAPRILEQAQTRMSRASTQGAKVSWQTQTTTRFSLPSDSVDMICAFSVFTHIEHEDAYHYLVDARRIVRPGGRMIFSCLPLELAVAKEIFRVQASVEFGQRWAGVRNIVTTRDFMNKIAEMAGWQVKGWYAGDEPNIPAPNRNPHPLGQSSCILM